MNFLLLNSHRFPKRNLLIASALLLLASFLSSYYFNKNPSVGGEVKELQNYILRQQRDFNELVKDSSLMRKLVRQEESLTEFKRIAAREYGFFLYAETLSEQGELLFWNNQNVLPTTNDLSLGEGEFFQHLSNGFYLIVKKRIQLSGMSNYVLAYALIPVFYQYEVESNYLVNSFAHDAKASKKMTLSEAKTPYDIKSVNNQHLFYIAHKTFASPLESDALTLILRIAALLLLLVYIQFMAEAIIKQYGATKGTIFLVVSLAAIRLLIYFFPSFLYGLTWGQ